MVDLKINPSTMFKSLKDLVLNCCERSFTRWFTIKFPAYQRKWTRASQQPLKSKIGHLGQLYTFVEKGCDICSKTRL